MHPTKRFYGFQVQSKITDLFTFGAPNGNKPTTEEKEEKIYDMGFSSQTTERTPMINASVKIFKAGSPSLLEDYLNDYFSRFDEDYEVISVQYLYIECRDEYSCLIIFKLTGEPNGILES